MAAIDPGPSITTRGKSGFSAQTSTWMTWFMGTFMTQFNAAIAALNFNSTNDASVTSNTIGTGAKVFTVSASKSFSSGMFLVIADSAAPATNYLLAQVTSYSGTTLSVNVISAAGSGTKTAWTISQSTPGAVSGNAVASLITNNFTGGQNFARTSVASSATPDIWTGIGNQVDYTGTTLATGFANAPQAGASRTLVMAGAASFTAGATLLIDGVVSGDTVVLGANDLVDVYAISTTQFRLSIRRYLAQPQARNYVGNGSLAIDTVVIGSASDNGLIIDRWRLLLGVGGAAIGTRDTADVPTGAAYALKLVVGAGNNNKFGVFAALANADITDLLGSVASLLVPLKATAGLTDGTGKIRIGILQWTGTADALTASPIASWGAEGTNPTLAAGWAFANTPAAIAVTTSWADYAVNNVAISSSAKNIGILIWSDDKVTTQTTDILRIGGYVTMNKGAQRPVAKIAAYDDEESYCLRWREGSFARTTAPAQNVGIGLGDFRATQAVGASTAQGGIWVPFKKRKVTGSGSITTYNPAVANAQVYNGGTATSCSATSTSAVGLNGFQLNTTTPAASVAGQALAFNWQYDEGW